MNHPHDEISHESLDRFWQVIDEIQNAILFLLLGFEVLIIPFTRRSLESGGLAIASVLIVRILVVAFVLGLIRLIWQIRSRSQHVKQQLMRRCGCRSEDTLDGVPKE